MFVSLYCSHLITHQTWWQELELPSERGGLGLLLPPRPGCSSPAGSLPTFRVRDGFRQDALASPSSLHNTISTFPSLREKLNILKQPEMVMLECAMKGLLG